MTMLYILRARSGRCDTRETGVIEIGRAIREAANQDPLFPFRTEGCRLTAALLLVMAIQRSAMRSTLVQQKRMGLYQILPPHSNLNGKLLLDPRSASLIAIDLIRTKVMTVTPEELAAAVEACRMVEERQRRPVEPSRP